MARHDNDDAGFLVYLLAAIAITICVIMLCGCVEVADMEAAQLPPETVTEHADGMPLDAIEYDPPAWMPDCYGAYRVYDRTNGRQWWVLMMHHMGASNYDCVVLPMEGVER